MDTETCIDMCACTFILILIHTYTIKKKRKMHKTGIVARPAIPALRRLRQEDSLKLGGGFCHWVLLAGFRMGFTE